MRRRGLVVAWLAFAIAGCSAPPASPAESGSGDPFATNGEPSNGPTQRPPLSSPAPVQAAARAVLEAGTTEARTSAILDILSAIGIGVYTASGDPIVVGAERGPDDFFAYDFEIDGLAAAIGAGDRAWLADLAADLVSIGVIDGTAGNPTAVLAAAIVGGVADALAEPADPSSYPLLVARELTLAGESGLDLASTDAEANVELDSLSAFLVVADLLLPIVAATPPPSSTSDQRTASIEGVAPLPALAAGPCGAIGSQLGQTGWHAGRGARRLPGGGASVNASASPYLQMLLVNSTVELRQTQIGVGVGGHYRHDPNDVTPNGMELALQLRIGAANAPILCGQLGGVTMPPSGPIVGVAMNWDYREVERHADVNCPAADCQSTDQDGTATLLYLSSVEPQPVGIGPEIEEYAWLRARPDVTAALAPALAAQVRGARGLSFGLARPFTWHRPYEVRMELISDLRIIEALTLIGHAADAHADGQWDVSSVRSSQTQPGMCDPRFCVGTVLEILDLNVRTTAATDGPQCEAPHVLINGPQATVDWFVLDAVIYPAPEIRVRMDSGPTNERLDTITLVQCKGPNIVSKPGTSSWEHYILKARSATGFVLEGLKAGSADGPGWDYIATDATWRSGGIVAVWDAPENCGGSCDPKKSRITITISVTPLPFP